MPRLNRRYAIRRGILNARQELDLLLGSAVGAFESPALRKTAWLSHRDQLIAALGPGCRPEAFWRYEGHSKLSRKESDRVALERLGLLTPEEKRILQKWARPHDVTAA